jgi:hypothetical protein
VTSDRPVVNAVTGLTDNGQIAYQSGLRYVANHGKNNLCRSCPRCNGYLWIVLREPGRNTPLQAVNGLGCGYRLAWIVIRGRQSYYL